MPYYKKRRKRINKHTIMLYSGIILACFLFGGIISFLTTGLPAFWQQNTKSSPPIEVNQVLEMQLDSADLEEIEKTYSMKIGNALHEQVKRGSQAEKTTDASEYVRDD